MNALQIVYDGECPFCTNYVTMVRLRDSVGEVELINARSNHPIVAEIKGNGLDLNEGMVVRYEGREYFGADAMNILSILTSDRGTLNRLVARLFANKRFARTIYPFLRGGRNLTLKFLGRKRIT